MNLIFQVPMQYCFLQHQALLPSPVTCTTRFVFAVLCLSILSGVISPLFSSSIFGTYQPGEVIFQCHLFLLFIVFKGFSRQEHWSRLPFPSPEDHILSEPSTVTSPCWMLLHSEAHSFIELDKAVVRLYPFVLFIPEYKSILVYSLFLD